MESRRLQPRLVGIYERCDAIGDASAYRFFASVVVCCLFSRLVAFFPFPNRISIFVYTIL